MDPYKEVVAMEQEEKLLLTSEEAAAMLRKSAMAFRDRMMQFVQTGVLQLAFKIH